MSHVTRLVLRVVINRIKGTLTLHEITLEQYGFIRDTGTGNAIFILQRLMERYVEKHKYVYGCFIDYIKAFDKVKHKCGRVRTCNCCASCPLVCCACLPSV